MTIATTLMNLMNTANHLGNTLRQEEDKAPAAKVVTKKGAKPAPKTPTKPSQAYFDKQAKLAVFSSNLLALEQELTDFPEIGTHDLNPHFIEVKKQITAGLAPLAGLTYPDKKFEQALNSAEFHYVNTADAVIKNLRRNLELRRMAALAMRDKTDADAKDAMEAYNKLCAQDAAIVEALRKDAAIGAHELDVANQRWAQYLAQKHKVAGLPENNIPKQGPIQNSGKQFFGNLLSAASDLFKSITDSKFTNIKAPLMTFIGKIASPIIGFFTKLLKPLFGSDEKAAEFTDNASKFIVGLVDSATSKPKSKGSDDDYDSDNDEDDDYTASAPILPAFEASKKPAAAPKPAPTPTAAPSLLDGLTSWFSKPKK